MTGDATIDATGDATIGAIVHATDGAVAGEAVGTGRYASTKPVPRHQSHTSVLAV